MRKFIATIALALVAAACTVPTPAEDPAWSELCIPSWSIRSQIMVTPIFVPEGASLEWNYRWEYGGPFPDGGVAFGATGSLVAGKTEPLGAPIDPGRCLHVKPSSGLAYGVTQLPYPDSGGPTRGWPPGVPYPVEYEPNPGEAPTTIEGISGVTAVDMLDAHTCAIVDGGEVWCWGQNTYGQLGDGTTDSRSTPAPVVGITDAVEVSVGSEHTCALKSDQTVVSWGRNWHGELGNGSTTDSAVPVPVLGLADVTDVSVSIGYSCAVSAGTIWCWGEDRDANFGNGTIEISSHTTPVAATGLTGVTQLSSGPGSSCAVVGGSALSCWGRDAFGNLEGVSPHDMGISDVVAVDAGIDSCAVRSTGEIYCWGSPTAGSIYSTPTPVHVEGVSDAVDVEVGRGSICALDAEGDVLCWGEGDSGELGVPGGPDSSSPVAVPTVSGATGISAGSRTACAVIATQVRCWGDNRYGQLGHPYEP